MYEDDYTGLWRVLNADPTKIKRFKLTTPKGPVRPEDVLLRMEAEEQRSTQKHRRNPWRRRGRRYGA